MESHSRATQSRIPGLDRLMISGLTFSWNETFAEYWSESEEACVLQDGEIESWRMSFNTGRQYTPQGQETEAKIVSQEICPILGESLWRLRFHDRSRGIYGAVALSEVTLRALMAEYDEGRCVGLSCSTY